jgi:hypothetical protein
MTCKERTGCLRFSDRDINPKKTPWASTLRPASLPAAEPCPKRITAAQLAANDKERAA